MGAFILSYIISLDYYYLIIIIKAGFLLLQSVEVEDSFNNFVLDCKPTDDFFYMTTMKKWELPPQLHSDWAQSDAFTTVQT